MGNMMPQEIEVFYVIPAIRKALARVFTSKHGMSQKQVASLLHITESAVSQYLKQKRGDDIKFGKKETALIENGAKKMLADKEQVMQIMYDLTVTLRGSEAMCDFHRCQDKDVEKDCSICME
tara:strand:+ start:251 stop:616 length:366 start_codon:yes stop_codon:yes gene_type:complete